MPSSIPTSGVAGEDGGLRSVAVSMTEHNMNIDQAAVKGRKRKNHLTRRCRGGEAFYECLARRSDPDCFAALAMSGYKRKGPRPFSRSPSLIATRCRLAS